MEASEVKPLSDAEIEAAHFVSTSTVPGDQWQGARLAELVARLLATLDAERAKREAAEAYAEAMVKAGDDLTTFLMRMGFPALAPDGRRAGMVVCAAWETARGLARRARGAGSGERRCSE